MLLVFALLIYDYFKKRIGERMDLKELLKEIPTIETERYILREILVTDVENLYEYYHNN